MIVHRHHHAHYGRHHRAHDLVVHAAPDLAPLQRKNLVLRNLHPAWLAVPPASRHSPPAAPASPAPAAGIRGPPPAPQTAGNPATAHADLPLRLQFSCSAHNGKSRCSAAEYLEYFAGEEPSYWRR